MVPVSLKLSHLESNSIVTRELMPLFYVKISNLKTQKVRLMGGYDPITFCISWLEVHAVIMLE